jgi:CysZ protein
MQVVTALLDAIRSMAHPRMMLLMIWPLTLAGVLWFVFAIFFGAMTVSWLQEYLSDSMVAQWTSQWVDFAWVAGALGWLAVVILYFPLVLVTASLIIGIFGMPQMVDHVASRRYPDLERKRGNGIVAMTVNAFFALFIFLLLSLLSLPLWFVPVLWPVIPILLFAYFNQRMFRFDALAEHASKEEMRDVSSRHGGEMFLLAILLSLLAHVPILGFFTPVISGLAFIHYGLARLAEARKAV